MKLILHLRHSLTPQGKHTLWEDDITMFCDSSNLNGNGNGAALAGAFQEMTRQKLISCKDAPATVLQIYCDLTKPSVSGDNYGRCNKVKSNETGKNIDVLIRLSAVFLLNFIEFIHIFISFHQVCSCTVPPAAAVSPALQQQKARRTRRAPIQLLLPRVAAPTDCTYSGTAAGRWM